MITWRCKSQKFPCTLFSNGNKGSSHLAKSVMSSCCFCFIFSASTGRFHIKLWGWQMSGHLHHDITYKSSLKFWTGIIFRGQLRDSSPRTPRFNRYIRNREFWDAQTLIVLVLYVLHPRDSLKADAVLLISKLSYGLVDISQYWMKCF